MPKPFRTTISRVRLGVVCLFVICFSLLAVHAEESKEKKEKEEKFPANRLAKESSPYLLQHAHNPVDWHPWGEEAFKKAEKEKKLIFLSVGYSACHWCHVMERESFANKEIAAILNKHFICIKVDREERPDVDDIYMNSLYVMEARGGWPMSVFLMPDGKPIVGGTYWPPEDRKIGDDTVRGFKSILNYMVDKKENNWKELQEQADAVASATKEQLAAASRAIPLLELDQRVVSECVEMIRSTIDPVHGGFGNKRRDFQGTKFPQPPALKLLLQQAAREKKKEALAPVQLTLSKMANGGIYDQLGGGFHRYSVERTWTVPHFEKMLYDNAQMVEVFSLAFQIDPNPEYRRIVQETLTFVKRELTSPEGGFYSALDADSDGKEGEYYVWTPEELEKIVTDKTDLAIFRAVFNVSGNPNFEEKSFILKRTRTLEEIAKEQKTTVEKLNESLARSMKLVMAARDKRVKPFLDTKILTSWNGQMIAGYATAGRIFKEKEYLTSAETGANFLLKNLQTKNGRLLRSYAKGPDGKAEGRLNAYLDDYAYFIHGLLCLHDATQEKKWLDEAKRLIDLMIEHHGEPNRGGFYYTSNDHEKLFARVKDFSESVQPSANGLSILNLYALASRTKEKKYAELAEKTIRQLLMGIKMAPTGVSTMLQGLQQMVDLEPAKPEPKKEKPLTKSTDTEGVVTLSAKETKGESRNVELTLTIEAPWHLYANPVQNNGLIESQTLVTVKVKGKPIDAKVSYPPGNKFTDSTGESYFIYEKTAVLKVELPKGDDPFEIEVAVQACSDTTCLKPSVLKFVSGK
jgi:uncharacterized protein YyaL (SSP411 family)